MECKYCQSQHLNKNGRRRGKKCCIAQVVLENNLLLIHNDRDLESLQHLRFQP